MNVLFSDAFVKSLRMHSAVKKEVRSRIDRIIENPIALGEPLKGHFRGYYSSPVKKNFIESFEQRLILVGGMDFHRKILKGNAERGFRVCPWIPCLL